MIMILIEHFKKKQYLLFSSIFMFVIYKVIERNIKFPLTKQLEH